MNLSKCYFPKMNIRMFCEIGVTACLLCHFNVIILVDSDGECVEIRTDDNTFPCTDEVKADTGCWDDEGNSQLCGASFIHEAK